MPSKKFSYLVSTCTCTVYLIRRSRRLVVASYYTQQTFYMYFRVIKITHKEITLYKSFIFYFSLMTMKMRQHIVVQQLCLQVHYNVYYKLQSLFDRIKPIQAPKPVNCQCTYRPSIQPSTRGHRLSRLYLCSVKSATLSVVRKLSLKLFSSPELLSITPEESGTAPFDRSFIHRPPGLRNRTR